ncbi:MAG: aldehyde dehydrogenase family protein [bacterium]
MSETMTSTHGGILEELGIGRISEGACWGQWLECRGEEIASTSPTDGTEIGRVRLAAREQYEAVMSRAEEAFRSWRTRPAPARGIVVRALADELRTHKKALGALVSLEMGKIRSEGEGEVQEMIDMADFAVGLSRQLYGLTMQSERPGHRMYEQWHPLGIVGVVTAFNFPVAVWAWNAMLAAVCGDVTIFKPSHRTPLTAVAVQNICNRVMRQHDCTGVFNLLIGDRKNVGDPLIHDRRVPLISATGSCTMGRNIGKTLADRIARSILELGGNNAVIVTEDADHDLALRAILFAAVGTAGQRCTSVRRVFLQKGIAAKFVERLKKAYASVVIGDPLEDGVLMGPLVDDQAVKEYEAAIETIKKQGGQIVYGGRRMSRPGCFVEPTLVKANTGMAITREETFAPILYLFEFDTVDEAIAANNAVDQGLSSSIFTTNLLSAEKFLAATGSDCGIANVNIGTSGAEIGGAFGGEKDTGGGREAGSDAWKMYMRRQTCTINWSGKIALAQGVHFDVE